ncbi:MAG: hypothetical protein SNI57_05440 [Rikenellaceae bacterium]
MRPEDEAPTSITRKWVALLAMSFIIIVTDTGTFCGNIAVAEPPCLSPPIPMVMLEFRLSYM